MRTIGAQGVSARFGQSLFCLLVLDAGLCPPLGVAATVDIASSMDTAQLPASEPLPDCTEAGCDIDLADTVDPELMRMSLLQTSLRKDRSPAQTRVSVSGDGVPVSISADSPLPIATEKTATFAISGDAEVGTLKSGQHLQSSRVAARAASALQTVVVATSFDPEGNATKTNATKTNATKTPEVKGHTTAFINTVDCIIVVFILVVVALGWFIDAHMPNLRPGDGHPSAKVAALLISSYMLLIPGLGATLFRFMIKVTINGIDLDTSTVLKKAGGISESMISLCGLLFDTGGVTGGILIILYAMVVPVVKLGLLTLGEAWRHSTNEFRLKYSRWCIALVQYVSKWACPDMFAYILILYLFRALDKPDSVLHGPAYLDVGFTCFSTFCVCSTISTLAIQPPAKVPGVEGGDVNSGVVAGLIRTVGYQGVGLIACLLVAPFVMFFSYGVQQPCMGLRLNVDLLIAQNDLDPSVSKVIAAMKVAEKVNTDVSLSECIHALHHWVFSRSEINAAFALLMLSIFVVALTVLDVLALAIAAIQLSTKGARGRALASARVLKHVSMLDVFVMGVVVTCLAGNAYHDKGVTFILQKGMPALLMAEALHYFMYSLVSGAADLADTSSDAAKPT